MSSFDISGPNERDAPGMDVEDDMDFQSMSDYYDYPYFRADDADGYESYTVTISAPKNGRRLTITLNVGEY